MGKSHQITCSQKKNIAIQQIIPLNHGPASWEIGKVSQGGGLSYLCGPHFQHLTSRKQFTNNGCDAATLREYEPLDDNHPLDRLFNREHPRSTSKEEEHADAREGAS